MVTTILMQHASYSYGIRTLARTTQLVAWNSEPPPLGPGWSSSPYFVAVAIMHYKQMWGRSVASEVSCMHFL